MPTRAPEKTKLTILRARHLSQHSWLLHGFSTRVGGYSRVYRKGDLNLGFTKDDARAAVERNRAAFVTALGATSPRASRARKQALWPIVTLRQIHSDLIHCIHGLPKEPLIGDGLITRTPGLLIAI